jgi:tetratricopeptide (TPR) repeat protein
MGNDTAKELYDKATSLFYKSKLNEAIILYSQAITTDPSYVNAYFKRGLCYGLLGKYTEAKNDAQAILKLEPDSKDAFYLMGCICEYEKNYSEAIKWFEETLRRDPIYVGATGDLDRVKKKAAGTYSSEDRIKDLAKAYGKDPDEFAKSFWENRDKILKAEPQTKDMEGNALVEMVGGVQEAARNYLVKGGEPLVLYNFLLGTSYGIYAKTDGRDKTTAEKMDFFRACVEEMIKRAEEKSAKS